LPQAGPATWLGGISETPLFLVRAYLIFICLTECFAVALRRPVSFISLFIYPFDRR